MDQITLPSKYVTGIKALDGRHTQLISIMVALVTLYKNPEKKKEKELELELAEYMRILRVSLKQHFLYEERYLEKIAYPESLAHKEAHKKLEELFVQVQKNARNTKGVQGLLLGVIQYLKNDLLTHIEIEDKKFAQFEKPAEAPVEVYNSSIYSGQNYKKAG